MTNVIKVNFNYKRNVFINCESCKGRGFPTFSVCMEGPIVCNCPHGDIVDKIRKVYGVILDMKRVKEIQLDVKPFIDVVMDEGVTFSIKVRPETWCKLHQIIDEEGAND